MTALSVYNTATRRKETFEPIEPGAVRMYSCGPTVYAPQHIGNMRPYVFADLLKRTLLALGLAVLTPIAIPLLYLVDLITGSFQGRRVRTYLLITATLWTELVGVIAHEVSHVTGEQSERPSYLEVSDHSGQRTQHAHLRARADLVLARRRLEEASEAGAVPRPDGHDGAIEAYDAAHHRGHT